ncbi:MAG: hypothetical protein QGG40_11565 [Myxococcota bacterium]|jgi:tetratricopeptide (TPR) repeat protein|nr:hypothetical protein [Myxococcota bacterium]
MFTWIAGLFLWFGVASAASPDMRVTVGSDASVEVMPRVRKGVAELIVRDCPTGLGTSLGGRTSKRVREIDVLEVGGGTWFLRVLLVQPDHEVRASIEGGVLSLFVVPASAGVVEMAQPAPLVEQLLDGTAEAGPSPSPSYLPLTFLSGDAQALPFEPLDYHPLYLRAPPALRVPTWSAVDLSRTRMLYAKTTADRARAIRDLGWLYLGMGFDREGRYYFELLGEEPSAVPPLEVALGRARAALNTGRWEEARDRLEEAYLAGAREATVVEGMAVVSLATGSPARPAVARALVQSTGRAEAMLLAAELLQREGYYEESLNILEAIAGKVPPNLVEMTALRLGDGYLKVGDFPQALHAYKETPEEIESVRGLLIGLLEQRPQEWLQSLPELARMASGTGVEAAESLYILAQVETIVGDHRDATQDYARFLREHPDLAPGSDVPARLWKLYLLRARQFTEKSRWFDVAVLHEEAWHRLLRREIDNPADLAMTATAYEEIQLPERAIHVLAESFRLLQSRQETNPDLMLRLARLYLQEGNWEGGLETLVYLADHGVPNELYGELAYVKGQLLEASSDLDGAANEYRKAASHAEYRTAASLRLAVMDAEAGDCDRSTSTLERQLASERVRRDLAGSGDFLALARCLTFQGRREAASLAAREAMERTTSEEEARYATYLISLANRETDEEAVSNLETGTDIWAVLAREQREAEEFAREVELRR